jgi:hypothetical protein
VMNSPELRFFLVSVRPSRADAVWFPLEWALYVKQEPYTLNDGSEKCQTLSVRNSLTVDLLRAKREPQRHNGVEIKALLRNAHKHPVLAEHAEIPADQGGEIER